MSFADEATDGPAARNAGGSRHPNSSGFQTPKLRGFQTPKLREGPRRPTQTPTDWRQLGYPSPNGGKGWVSGNPKRWVSGNPWQPQTVGVWQPGCLATHQTVGVWQPTKGWERVGVWQSTKGWERVGVWQPQTVGVWQPDGDQRRGRPKAGGAYLRATSKAGNRCTREANKEFPLAVAAICPSPVSSLNRCHYPRQAWANR
jgi:hypothetical protein